MGILPTRLVGSIEALIARFAPSRLRYRVSQEWARWHLSILTSGGVSAMYSRLFPTSRTEVAKGSRRGLERYRAHSKDLVKNDCVAFLSIGTELDKFLLNSVSSLRAVDSSIPVFVFVEEGGVERVSSLMGSMVSVVALDFDSSYIAGPYRKFGSKEFNYVSNLKWAVVLELFRRGYDLVVYSDVDIVFRRSFRDYIRDVGAISPGGMQSEAQDIFPPLLCTGFMFFSSSLAPEISHLAEIARKSKYSFNDQDIFNASFLERPTLQENIVELPVNLFPNGLLIDHVVSQSSSNHGRGPKPYLFHANWVVGEEGKIELLKKAGGWNV